MTLLNLRFLIGAAIFHARVGVGALKPLLNGRTFVNEFTARCGKEQSLIDWRVANPTPRPNDLRAFRQDVYGGNAW
jgi:hypothetical protein